MIIPSLPPYLSHLYKRELSEREEKFGLVSRRAVGFIPRLASFPASTTATVEVGKPSSSPLLARWKPLPVLGALMISELASAATAAPATPHLLIHSLTVRGGFGHLNLIQ